MARHSEVSSRALGLLSTSEAILFLSLPPPPPQFSTQGFPSVAMAILGLALSVYIWLALRLHLYPVSSARASPAQISPGYLLNIREKDRNSLGVWLCDQARSNECEALVLIPSSTEEKQKQKFYPVFY